MDALGLGQQPTAAVIRRFRQMLEKLIRPAIPRAANDLGPRNHEIQDANPGPGQTTPVALWGPAHESTPDPHGIDTTLWDHGIDGLLQERVQVGSQRNRWSSSAFCAAAFLASGLVGSELNDRPRAGSRSGRKPRPEPRQ
jgi:hypothetical protein